LDAGRRIAERRRAARAHRFVLQDERLVFGTDTLQIARDGVTTITLAFSFEKLFPALGITGDDIDLNVALRHCREHFCMQVRRDIGCLFLLQTSKRRHAFIRSALLQKCTELLPIVILEDNGGVQ
jgi:hypothetical protein